MRLFFLNSDFVSNYSIYDLNVRVIYKYIDIFVQYSIYNMWFVYVIHYVYFLENIAGPHLQEMISTNKTQPALIAMVSKGGGEAQVVR